jgi:hypothetical protein
VQRAKQKSAIEYSINIRMTKRIAHAASALIQDGLDEPACLFQFFDGAEHIVHYLFQVCRSRRNRVNLQLSNCLRGLFPVLSTRLTAATDRAEAFGTVFHQPGLDLIEVPRTAKTVRLMLYRAGIHVYDRERTAEQVIAPEQIGLIGTGQRLAQHGYEAWEAVVFGRNILDKVGYDGGAIGHRLAGTIDLPCGARTVIANGSAECNFVQGVNNPVGYGRVRGENATGQVTTYSVTPPALYGIELRYKL